MAQNVISMLGMSIGSSNYSEVLISDVFKPSIGHASMFGDPFTYIHN